MKALSLTQPWATLIGIKHIETRPWSTNYRGELAIHASKTFPRWAIELAIQEPFRSALLSLGIRKLSELPLGAVISVTDLYRCRPTERLLEDPVLMSVQEEAFGDYSPGRFGLLLRHEVRLPEPIHCKGALGLWDVPEETVARIEEQLGRRFR